MHDYADMRRGIHELMTGFDPVPETGTTAAFGWSESERRAAAERLGLDGGHERLAVDPRQSS